MTTLRKKLYRDLGERKGANIALIIVIAMGIMVYVSFSLVMDNLLEGRALFYKELKFAQGFLDVEEIPRNTIEELKKIDGILEIEGRIIKDVRVLGDEFSDGTYIRLVSISSNLNRVEIIKGSYPRNDGEIIIEDKFAKANKLKLQDKIEISVNGKRKLLQVSGIGISPEYIYAMKNSSDIFPQPEKFGIGFIEISDISKMTGMNNSYNNVSFMKASEIKFREIEIQMREELKKYKVKSIIERKDQLSHLMIQQELDQLNSMAKSLPVLFLGVSSLILYIMLKRMVDQHRNQIGILKAFGFKDGQILIYYMSYSIIIGGFGGLLGAIFGIFLSFPYTDLYATYFSLPNLKSHISIKYIFYSLFFSILFSCFAGFQASKASINLSPSKAMRPEQPPNIKFSVFEKIDIIWSKLDIKTRLAFRNIERNPFRSFFIILGISMTFGILSVPWSMSFTSEKMIMDRYYYVEKYDLKINLESPKLEKDVIRELQNKDYVKLVEPSVEIPGVFKFKGRKKEVLLQGIDDSSKLYILRDADNNKVEIKERGLVISKRIADILKVKVGDELIFESPYLKDKDKKEVLKVGKIISQSLGIAGYIDKISLDEILESKGILTSILVKSKNSNISSLQIEYKDSKSIASISDIKEMVSKMKELLKTMKTFVYAMGVFGILTGFSIIYNSLAVTLSERTRDIASLKVLGMDEGEIYQIMSIEQWILTFIGIIMGIPMSKFFITSMATSMTNDVYTMPLTLDTYSLLLSLVATIISVFIGKLGLKKKIIKVDMVESLKSIE